MKRVISKGKPAKQIRNTIKLCLITFLVVCLTGCGSSLNSVQIHSENTNFDINQEETLSLDIDPKDSELDMNDFHSSDENVVSIKDLKDQQLIISSTDKEGSVTIYYEKGDIKSNTITIQVVDKQKALAIAQAKKEAEETKKKEEEKKKQEEAEKEAQQKQAEEQKKKTESQKKSSSSTSSQSKTSTSKSSDTNGQMVYIPKTGKKYHSNSSCSNMKKPSCVTLGEAQSRGYTPCKKCY